MLTRLSSGLFIALIALSATYLCASGPNEHASVASAIPAQSPTPQDASRTRTASTDFSGSYFGRLEYPPAGLSGVGTMVIRDNRFEITIESTTIAGTISFVAKGRAISAVLKLDQPPTGSTVTTIRLEAEKEGKDIWLISAEDEKTDFYFGTRSRTRNGGRDPASVNTNASANTSANTSANSNRPRPTPRPTSRPTPITIGPPVMTGGGEDPDPPAEGPDFRPRSGPRPRSGTRATGGMESPANSNTEPSATPAPASNTNGSFSSQMRGEANVGFQVPESMRMDETKSIELVVSPTESAESIRKGLEAEEGKTETATTRYSDRMEAKLVGTGFTITPAGPDIQPVEPGEKTIWRWQIQPKAGGTQRLDLTLNAIVNDGKDRKLITALKREITIKVTWGQRASTWLGAVKDIHWLWGALIVPIAGAVYAWWRKRGSKRPRKKKPKTKS